MSHIKVKSFIFHSHGIRYWDCADRIAMNIRKGRFAVADGVTRSYLPNLWAEILCNSFVNDKAQANEDWIGSYITGRIIADCQKWAEECQQTLQDATEDERFVLELSLGHNNEACSTFAGIAIADDSLYYNVIGDSCIFVEDKEKTENLQKLSSTNEREGYANRPYYISSSGHIHGEWKYGYLKLRNGYVMLMTDAISNWVLKKRQETPDFMDQLWALTSHEDFIQMIEKSRDTDELKDDDVALLMLRIEDFNGTGYQVEYYDNIHQHIKKEKANNNTAPQPDNNKSEKRDTNNEKAKQLPAPVHLFNQDVSILRTRFSASNNNEE